MDKIATARHHHCPGTAGNYRELAVCGHACEMRQEGSVGVVEPAKDATVSAQPGHTREIRRNRSQAITGGPISTQMAKLSTMAAVD